METVVLISSNAEDSSISVAALETNRTLSVLKAAHCDINCVAAAGNDYVYAAHTSKPAIGIWSWRKVCYAKLVLCTK